MPDDLVGGLGPDPAGLWSVNGGALRKVWNQTFPALTPVTYLSERPDDDMEVLERDHQRMRVKWQGAEHVYLAKQVELAEALGGVDMRRAKGTLALVFRDAGGVVIAVVHPEPGFVRFWEL